MPPVVLKPGDIIRLKIGSREMLVSRVLDADTIECTYVDGERQVRAVVPTADVIKVDTPANPDLPAPD